MCVLKKCLTIRTDSQVKQLILNQHKPPCKTPNKGYFPDLVLEGVLTVQ